MNKVDRLPTIQLKGLLQLSKNLSPARIRARKKWMAGRYSENCGRSLDLLCRTADILKLTDAEFRRVARKFHTVVARMHAAEDWEAPFLDRAMATALKEAQEADPVPEPAALAEGAECKRLHKE